MNYDNHHRRSIRLQGYDYSKRGCYFITICIHERERNLFGVVIDGRMILNDAGQVVKRCLHEIPAHFPHVRIDEHIVMPNHVHAIIQIVGNPAICAETKFGEQNAVHLGVVVPDNGRSVGSVVGVQNFEPLRNTPVHGNTPDNVHETSDIGEWRIRQPRQKPSRCNEYQYVIPGSVGSVVRGFKIGVTKWFRECKPGVVVWQRNFYEHVIRDLSALQNIRGYIRRNPDNWHRDAVGHIDRELDRYGRASCGANE